jgi:predicted aconitase
VRESLELTADEQAVMDGASGEISRKLMETVVLYAHALDADRLADIEGPGHLVVQDARPGWGARMEFLEEVASAGLTAAYGFTIDPPGPWFDRSLDLSPEQHSVIDGRRGAEERYLELMLQLGLRDSEAATCTPWFRQVGNRPKYGQIIAWAESSAVIFVNSVLGARTHRNAGVIELISNLVGKTPNAGLVTDAGRTANWLVEVKVGSTPDPQALGYVVGREVLDGVPFVTGLDGTLNGSLDGTTLQWLHDFGTNCAVGGGVGLFHIEGITPEAVRFGRQQVAADARHILIDDQLIEDTLRIMRADRPRADIRPDRCLVGCPHLTIEQLHRWTDRIGESMTSNGRSSLAVKTVFVAAPDVITAFQEDGENHDRLIGWGVRLSSFCLEALMQDRSLAPPVVATNSNKLRHYNRGVHLFDDAELVEIMVTGGVPGGTDNERGV